METCLVCCAFGGAEETAVPFVSSLWCLTDSSSVRKGLITTLSPPIVTTSTALCHPLWLSPIPLGFWGPSRDWLEDSSFHVRYTPSCIMN